MATSGMDLFSGTAPRGAKAGGAAASDVDAVLVAGPTASGKSALAMRLATQLAGRLAGEGGTVVNADSMQVYSGLRVLTARPSAADETRVPHRLYGHVDPRETYSVARWTEDVTRALAELRAAGRVPIVTGGTGLYFRALLHGLSPVPPIEPAIRATVRAALERDGAAALHGQLGREDPEGARRLRPSDGQRVARALEVVRSTGRPLHAWQGAPARPILSGTIARLLVMPPRAELHERIARRTRAMLEGGRDGPAAAEVRRLRALDPPATTAARALGVSTVSRLLDGAIDHAEAERRLTVETRRYAKRQSTWFRNQLQGWTLVTADSG